MAEEPAYIRNLRAITRTSPRAEDVDDIERELYSSGSDRAMAIMFGSFVENNLEYLLAAHMRQDLNSKDRKMLFEYEGAVGTFSSKIVVAYALKLIGPTCRADLDIIRFLRNEFAHSRIHFSFETPEVKTICDQFKIVDLPGTHIPSNYLNRVPESDLVSASDMKHPKTRFISECHSLSHRMITARRNHLSDGVPFNEDPLP